MNIILIGFMGAGKSVVGRGIALQKGMEYLDCDEIIENEQKQKISEIFAQKGEPYFRDLETALLKSLQNRDKVVLATGGGMILREENVRMLKQLGKVVLLSAEPDVILERLKYSKNRPLLDGDKENKIGKIIMERKAAYAQAADYTIDTSSLLVDQVIEEVIKWAFN